MTHPEQPEHVGPPAATPPAPDPYVPSSFYAPPAYPQPEYPQPEHPAGAYQPPAYPDYSAQGYPGYSTSPYPDYSPQTPTPPAYNPDPSVAAFYPYAPYAPYAYPPRRETDGLAIASLIVSCASILGICTYGVGSVLGIVGAILGHVARNRIQRSGAAGSGLALAGIIVGWTISALTATLVALIVTLTITDPSF